MMTKTEQALLDRIQGVNDRGGLAGGVGPDNEAFEKPDNRFLRRLYVKGAIVWVKYTPALGAGWAIAGHAIAKSNEGA